MIVMTGIAAIILGFYYGPIHKGCHDGSLQFFLSSAVAGMGGAILAIAFLIHR